MHLSRGGQIRATGESSDANFIGAGSKRVAETIYFMCLRRKEEPQGAKKVKVFRDFTNLPPVQRAVTIGVFDGVHLGHRSLLSQLVSAARERNLAATVITFSNHPQSVLSPPPPPLLMTIEERLEMLEKLGIDETVLTRFTPELSHLTYKQFCFEILIDKLNCKLLIVGEDFALGYRREGTVERLRELGAKWGVEVVAVPPITSEGIRISSSVIRQLLLQGDVERARELLGMPYRIVGTIIAGAARGRKLGFPTINLKVEPEKLLPRFGVYAGNVLTAQGSWKAASYIGRRPTFGETEPVVEAHLLDFNGTVPYGTKVAVELIAFIRPDQKFESPESLIAQINRDVQAVREKLKAVGR